MNDVKIRNIKDSDELIRIAVFYAVRYIVTGVAGFFSAIVSVEGISPFGVAYVASIFPSLIPSAAFGAILGYFHVYGVNVLTLRYISACAVAGILSYLLKRNLKRRYHVYFSTASSFFTLLATGLVLSLSVTVSSEEVMLYTVEGVIGGAAAWFIDRFLSIKPSKRYISRLSGSETASVLIVFGLILMSLGSFDIYIFSPAVIFGVYAVLAASSFGGDKAGALSGIVAGVVLGFVTPDSFLTGGVALGGLLTGFFGRQNRFFSALIFVITVSATAFTAEDWISAINVLYSVGIATAAFVLTPKKIAKIYRSFFAFSQEDTFLTEQRNVLKMRLRTAADGMTDVTTTVKAVAGIYRRRSAPKEDDIYNNVCSRVCSQCHNYNRCWNVNYDSTNRFFRTIAEVLRHSNAPDGNDLPDGFFDVCCKPETIVKNISYEAERYRNAMRESAKTGETVNIVSDQFGSVAQLLDSFSETMDSGEEYDAEKTGMVCDVLVNDLGLEVTGCGVFRNEDSKLFCEICFPSDEKYDEQQIAHTVSEVLSVRFENPVVHTLSDSTVTLTLCERTKYTVETGGYQISSDGGKWCGDTFDTFFDGKGKMYMILSDGMGTGKKAAADSVMCCSLASVLLRAGYPVDCILKMINSAMLVRSGEESLATLDIAVINLYNGEVEFFKAGAAPSVAMRHLKLLKIQKPSLPVGILGNVKFEKVELNLRDGDSFVLMSDGVSENAVSMWREILKDATDYKGKELADKLAKTAHMNADNDNADDITVVIAAVRMNE